MGPTDVGDDTNPKVIYNGITKNKLDNFKIVFDIYQAKDINQYLIEGLMFEIELYKAFKKISVSKRKAYESRIEDSLKRAGLGG